MRHSCNDEDDITTITVTLFSQDSLPPRRLISISVEGVHVEAQVCLSENCVPTTTSPQIMTKEPRSSEEGSLLVVSVVVVVSLILFVLLLVLLLTFLLRKTRYW